MSKYASCPMVRHPDWDDSDPERVFPDWLHSGTRQAGHFCYTPSMARIILVLPALGGPSLCILPIDGSRGWKLWEGGDLPTITPSIFHCPSEPDSPHAWHGFVTKGQMLGCDN